MCPCWHRQEECRAPSLAACSYSVRRPDGRLFALKHLDLAGMGAGTRQRVVNEVRCGCHVRRLPGPPVLQRTPAVSSKTQSQTATHRSLVRRLLASLHHPHLVRFHEAFVDAGHLNVVMELLHGDLRSVLE